MKLKSPILFTALIAVSMIACKQNETTTAGTTSNKDVVIPDSVLVDESTAREYVKNYAPHAGYVDQTNEDVRARLPKKPDTRCVWFSKKRLQDMLDKLENEKGDGVRFYLITYNKKYDTTVVDKKKPIPQKEYWGYNTLLMVSTKPDHNKAGTPIHLDYYQNSDNQQLNAAKKQEKKSPGFIVTFVPENRGELCPPPADCSSIGATLLDNPLHK
ncbi:hypothetical protein H7F33_04230 [Pedobacter sp. PAMC26386]|nr:hypothetical protein H7F33_04230 [Pedobacter sp. PAMC26386]